MIYSELHISKIHEISVIFKVKVTSMLYCNNSRDNMKLDTQSQVTSAFVLPHLS